MKKILLVNTRYREFGGEDSNFSEEFKFLSKEYYVDSIEFENKGRIKFFDILGFIFNSNIISNKELKLKIKEFKPDLAYVHNTWFRGNLGIFKVLKKEKIPIIHKIHNFRFDCTNSYFSYKHLNDKNFCAKCGYNKKFSLFNKYFDESLIKSFAAIKYGKKYMKILKTYDLKILVMTNFQKNYLSKIGLDSNNIYIFENPITTENFLDTEYNSNSNYIIYAGRVSSEKGVQELIESWNKSNLKNLVLKIIGSGSLLESLKQRYQSNNIEFLGHIPNEDVLRLIKHSRSVVTATRMYEGQPKLLCEASSFGVPAIFPSFGGMVEFYPKNYEFMFEQFNYNDLIDKLNLLVHTEILQEQSDELIKFINYKLSNKNLMRKFNKIIKP